MFLLGVEIHNDNVGEGKLPHANLQIDPRPIFNEAVYDGLVEGGFDDQKNITFEITNPNGDGRSMKFTIVDGGWLDGDLVSFRVYDPSKEHVPSFTSTTYNYLGIPGETAPLNTVKAIIDDSVKVIGKLAFARCDKMKVCTMHDNVEEIGEKAFLHCTFLTIRLSRNMKRICSYAFDNCTNLEAIFIPSRTEKIEYFAFDKCCNVGIVSIPPSVSIGRLLPPVQPGRRGRSGPALQELWSYSHFECNRAEWHYREHRVDGQSLHDFYCNQQLPSLFKTCLDTNVTVQSIRNCVIGTHEPGRATTTTAFITNHDGMTPLHILVINPYADTVSIVACLNLNMNAAFTKDNFDCTPIDYLWKYGNIAGIVCVIQALCLHSQATRTSNVHVGESVDDKEVLKRQKIE